MLRGSRRWWWAGGAGLVLAIMLAWALWPSGGEPRPREYHDATACLLTGRDGLADHEAGAVWAGMQDASARTSGQIRYLAVTGEQSVQNASTFVGTLLLGRCAVIVASGQSQVAAVAVTAGTHASQRFIVVTGTSPSLSNVVTVANSTPDGLRTAVADQVTPLLQTRS
jgi:hypothetical protein